MESEKVKEIKKAIQETIDGKLSTEYLTVCEISCCPILDINKLFPDILTYINELESENETFLESKTMWKRLHTEVCKENQQLKDRITELEKENEELKQDIKKSIDMQKEMLDGFKTATKEVEENLAREIPNLLKQFAERLKEKGKEIVTGESVDVLVELLRYSEELVKEYTNENGKV